MKEIKQEHTGIVYILFHDFSEKAPDLEAWLKDMLLFLKEKGIVWEQMKSVGRSKKVTSFERALQQHKANGFSEARTHGLWFTTTSSKSSYETADAILSAGVCMGTGETLETLALCLDEQIIPFHPEKLRRLVVDIIDFFKPNYGYGYAQLSKKKACVSPLMPHLERPELGGDTELKRQIASLRDVYNPGNLQDIYPMNLLSPIHLRHVVQGKFFFDWIRTNAARGELMALKDELWMWWVEPQNIPAIREVLRPMKWLTRT